MPVLFNEIPQSDLRVPLFYAEVNAGGFPSTGASRLLLIGQKLAAGSATAEEPVLVSAGAEDSLFGSNSMLAAMVRVARENAPFQEIWALPLEDDGAAAAATATVDLTTLALPLTTAQAFTIYVGGRRYRVGVSTADTATDIGDALVQEINNDLCAHVTAANLAGVVTLTARHAGAASNEIDIRTGYYGTEAAFANDATITGFAGGATDPDFSAALINLGEDAFDWIASPYSDAANLDAMKDFLSNSTGRWSPYEQLYGHYITATVGTVGTLSAAGLLRNDPHASIVGVNGYPTPHWEIASAVGAKAAKHLSSAPELSRPLQFITLAGIKAPKIADRFARVDRNTLLMDGIASLGIAADNSVVIERLITTYRLNAVGFEDMTWLDVNTVAQTMYAVRYLRSKLTSAHGRQALANDDNPPIQGVSRPRDIRSTIIAGYVELNQLAVVENLDVFEAALVVERSATDPNRVDVYLPIDVVNQLRIMAVNATTFLAFPSEV